MVLGSHQGQSQKFINHSSRDGLLGLVLVLFLAHQNAVKANTFLQVPHTEAHPEAVRNFN